MANLAFGITEKGARRAWNDEVRADAVGLDDGDPLVKAPNIAALVDGQPCLSETATAGVGRRVPPNQPLG